MTPVLYPLAKFTPFSNLPIFSIFWWPSQKTPPPTETIIHPLMPPMQCSCLFYQNTPRLAKSRLIVHISVISLPEHSDIYNSIFISIFALSCLFFGNENTQLLANVLTNAYNGMHRFSGTKFRARKMA